MSENLKRDLFKFELWILVRFKKRIHLECDFKVHVRIKRILNPIQLNLSWNNERHEEVNVKYSEWVGANVISKCRLGISWGNYMILFRCAIVHILNLCVFHLFFMCLLYVCRENACRKKNMISIKFIHVFNFFNYHVWYD